MTELALIFDSNSGAYIAKPVGSTHIDAGAVVSGKLGLQAVLSGNIASGHISWPHMALGGVLSGQIASGQIGPHIAAGGVLSAHVVGGVLATPHMANQGLLSASFGAAAIGDAHMNANETWGGRDFGNRLRVAMGGGTGAFIWSGTMHIDADTSETQVFLMQNLNGTAQLKILMSGILPHYMEIRGRVTPGIKFFEGQAGAQGATAVMTEMMRLISGNITQLAQVDSVDISAHTHTGGAGDAPVILSAGLGSGLAHKIEAIITSADVNGFWSAAWKAAFTSSPVVMASPLGSGDISVMIYNATTALTNGWRARNDVLGGAGVSGLVHILAHEQF